MQERFVDLFTDYGFKKIFREEINIQLLMDFINAILGKYTGRIVSLDSRSATVNDHITLEVTRADFVAKLIKIEGYSLLETLRAKLSWGFDRRN